LIFKVAALNFKPHHRDDRTSTTQANNEHAMLENDYSRDIPAAAFLKKTPLLFTKTQHNASV